MTKLKIFIKITFAIMLVACLLTFSACIKSEESNAQDILQSAPTQKLPTQSVIEDKIDNHVSLNKKYFYLGYDGVDDNQYYTIGSDGVATYTHVMKTAEKITFHQIINFKWTYAGDGECILVHNGTKMLKGEQDDAFGISRAMRLSKNIIYWSASGENTYYICEDYISQIPSYAKLINS